MRDEKIKVQSESRERHFVRCYHDFIDCDLLTGEEKITFLILKRFLDIRADQGNVYPTLKTIQKMTRWGKNKVLRIMDSLQKKGVVIVKRRGLSRSNIYVINDKRDMWKSQTIEELQAAAEETGLEKAIRLIEAAGGQVSFPDKEKGLITDVKPTKATTDISTHSKNLCMDNPTVKKSKSQDRKNAFHNFEQRSYDYDELEKRLTNRGASHE